MQGMDESIVLFLQGLRSEPLTGLLSIFMPPEFWIWVAVLTALFFFLRSGRLHVPVVSFVLAWIISDYCYKWGKAWFARPRPFLTVKGAVPLMPIGGFSFPSGHSTLAMAAAVVLAYHFPRARTLVYALAVCVGFSRVYGGFHYLTDVLAGFLLGLVVGWVSLLLERAILMAGQPGGRLKATGPRGKDKGAAGD